MKAKFVRDFLFEFERAEDTDSYKDILKIGNIKARAENILKKFAEDNKYKFEVNRNGNFKITAKIPGGGLKSYSVTFPDERADTETPISLRNQAGQLMDRFANGSQVLARIKGNIEREAKRLVKQDKPEELLLKAVQDGDEKKVKELLDSGVSPDHKVRSNIEENIPLLVAIGKENFEIVKDLIEAGADPNIKSKRKWTPVTRAISAGTSVWDKSHRDRAFKIFKYLLDSGGSLEEATEWPNFDWTLGNTSFKIFKYVVETLGKDNFDEQYLVDTLCSDVWMGRVERAKFLLELGIDPYKKSSMGRRNNAFESLEETKGYMEDYHRPTGENYHYEEMRELLKKYR